MRTTGNCSPGDFLSLHPEGGNDLRPELVCNQRRQEGPEVQLNQEVISAVSHELTVTVINKGLKMP